MQIVRIENGSVNPLSAPYISSYGPNYKAKNNGKLILSPPLKLKVT